MCLMTVDIQLSPVTKPNVFLFITFLLSLHVCLADPARVVNMPPVIYVAIGLPGYIRCPVDANPPVTSVKWKKDGLPLRIEKVNQNLSPAHTLFLCFLFHIRPTL